MKLIVAVIQPFKLPAVKEALRKIEVLKFTASDAEGYGQQRGHVALYRGLEYKVELLRKIELEILVNDDFLDRTLDAIRSAALTGADGNIGDGKIFVLPVERAVRIRTGETGPGAV
ncbi:MAG TPA: P-II family nitrogen regulator [Pirellulales bacterium]